MSRKCSIVKIISDVQSCDSLSSSTKEKIIQLLSDQYKVEKQGSTMFSMGKIIPDTRYKLGATTFDDEYNQEGFLAPPQKMSGSGKRRSLKRRQSKKTISKKRRRTIRKK
jgi:hypothetical protein